MIDVFGNHSSIEPAGGWNIFSFTYILHFPLHQTLNHLHGFTDHYTDTGSSALESFAFFSWYGYQKLYSF